MGDAGENYIVSINGQVVKARGDVPFKMLEAVRVGNLGLIGEVIKVSSEVSTIQVYEVTTGLRIGEPVAPTGSPLSIALGPGLLGNFFDGIQRPLAALERATGPFIVRGVEVSNLDEDRKWPVRVLARQGMRLSGGDTVAEIAETPSIAHKVLVPPGMAGEVVYAAPDGKYSVTETLARLRLDADGAGGGAFAGTAAGGAADSGAGIAVSGAADSGAGRAVASAGGGTAAGGAAGSGAGTAAGAAAGALAGAGMAAAGAGGGAAAGPAAGSGAGIAAGWAGAGENAAAGEGEGGPIAEITAAHKWPIRRPRPIRERVRITAPLVTGQRVIDTFFPIGKGGAAAIPGSFGTGKTMAQHQIAKWADADIIVYIGCGERGNEMTEVLEDFPKLIDPRTGRSLMERTILIANTSNMPVAAREASIYTGIPIAEYYRDMGYNVAVMADSTSRWAEALREISGRLEEMPAEEGFPAYLSSRLSEFYERAGNVATLGGSTGSISIIGAVSPQGGDFSEPVTQNTKRYIRCFWGLDRQLAYARHYPAVNWITSYSEYLPELAPWFAGHVGGDFLPNRNELMRILLEESKLQDIVKLVGSDILADEQKLTLEVGAVIRLGFLQQAAFHPVDTFVPLEKQNKMMELILFLHDRVQALVKKSVPMSDIKKTGVFEIVVKAKFDVPNGELGKFDGLKERIEAALDALA
jgi:vacuolar-type H+-ATPase catalytic subunit A/Vma1